MAGAVVSIDVAGIASLTGFLDDIASADTHQLLLNIAEAGETFTDENFQFERSPDKIPWAPSFRAKMTGKPTLQLGGQLRDGIAGEVVGDTVVVGTSKAPYARIHQEGGVIRGNPHLKFNIPGLGWRTVEEVIMPKRQFLGWGRDLMDEVENLTNDFFSAMLPSGS